MAANGVSVLTGILINLITAIVCFLVFSILRTWQGAVKFYDPKVSLEKEHSLAHSNGAPGAEFSEDISRLWVF